jgi:hypothetical protein
MIETRGGTREGSGGKKHGKTERILQLYKQGLESIVIAERLGMAHTSVCRIIKLNK